MCRIARSWPKESNFVSRPFSGQSWSWRRGGVGDSRFVSGGRGRVVVLVPGPEFAVVTRNTLPGGRRRPATRPVECRRRHLLDRRSRRGRRHRIRRRRRYPTAVRGDQAGWHRLPGVLCHGGAEVSGSRAAADPSTTRTRLLVGSRAGGTNSSTTPPTARSWETRRQATLFDS